MPSGGIFKGDPLTGTGTVTYGDGSQQQMSYLEFTGGLMFVEGGQRVDFYNRFNRISIGRQGEFTSEQLSNNTFSFISETRRGAVNSIATSDTLRLASGSIAVNLPNGQTLDMEFSAIPVAAAGYQWAMYTQSDGTQVPTRVPARYLSNAELQADYNASWRLARPEEVIFNAAAYAVAGEHAAELEQIARDMGIDKEGELETYDLIQSVLFQAGSVTNVRVFSSIFPG